MQKNEKYYDEQAKMKLTDHEANIGQTSKKAMLQVVSKKICGSYIFKICEKNITSYLITYPKIKKHKILASLQMCTVKQNFICDNLFYSCIVLLIFFQLLF